MQHLSWAASKRGVFCFVFLKRLREKGAPLFSPRGWGGGHLIINSPRFEAKLGKAGKQEISNLESFENLYFVFFVVFVFVPCRMEKSISCTPFFSICAR